eukprot:SAG31_NODE_2415_length_5732_cov_7.567016_4_plen_52_part_00
MVVTGTMVVCSCHPALGALRCTSARPGNNVAVVQTASAGFVPKRKNRHRHA